MREVDTLGLIGTKGRINAFKARSAFWSPCSLVMKSQSPEWPWGYPLVSSYKRTKSASQIGLLLLGCLILSNANSPPLDFTFSATWAWKLEYKFWCPEQTWPDNQVPTICVRGWGFSRKPLGQRKSFLTAWQEGNGKEQTDVGDASPF